MSTLSVATVAMETAWKDPRENAARVERHVREVKKQHPDMQIILFPEMAMMGYVLDDSNRELAESMDGYCVTEVGRIAKDNSVAIAIGMIEKGADKPYNTVFVVDKEGTLIAAYRKNHLYSESPEPQLFARGEGLTTFDFKGWKCGLSICFDIRFPRLFETYKKVAGVECMFSPFSWPMGRNKPAIMEHLVKARAHENQFFFVATDCTGTDPNATYCSQSVITNPYSESIATRDGVYSYAVLDKKDIEALSKALPLAGSFKESYEFN